MERYFQIANPSTGLQSTDQESVMQENMSQQHKRISFSKKMHKSEITDHFVLRMPKWFCDAHLPSHDENIVLVDESERGYNVRYVMKEHRLQCGWRDFVIAKGLVEEDTLVFDLVDVCKFKVHITRASKSIQNEVQNSEGMDFGLQTIIGNAQAVKLQANMPTQKYSFRKKMHQSNLSNKYYLRLPKGFCNANLPCQDDNIVLVDVSEREYNVRFAVNQNRLHRGWKDFVIAHGLLEGDTVDFNLIDERKFKVQITRTSRSPGNEFQLNKLVNLVEKKNLIEENACIDNTATQKYLVSRGRGVDNHQIQDRSKQDNFGKRQPLPQAKLPINETGPNILPDEHKAALDRIKELEMQLGVSSVQPSSSPKLNVDKEKEPKILEYVDETEEEMVDEMHCWTRKRVLEEVDFEETTKYVCTRNRSPEIDYANCDSSLNSCSNDILHWATLNFNDIKGSEDFKIQVNGETLDSEIPETIRKKYYQLCCGQKKFIHHSVMMGHSTKFVAAMILEIVSIADTMKTASILTSRDYLECMEKKLKSFEDLGMSVGSLRAKIGSLIKFSSEHKTLEETSRMTLAEIERERKAIEEKRAKINRLEEKADALNAKREELRLVFNEVAGSSP